MSKFEYTTMNNILGKFHRDFRGLDIHESDAIEWVGDALDYMKIASAMEEAVAFVEVKDFQIDIPNYLHYIIHIARANDWEGEDLCPAEVEAAIEEDVNCDNDCKINIQFVDCNGVPIFDEEEKSNPRPYFDLQWEYDPWMRSRYYKQKYSPVVLANHSFFNTLVCQDPNFADLYRNSNLYDEYSPVKAAKKIRFSFETGYVAVAYLRQKMDEDGYPMIPDNKYARQAITYFLLWKIKEREAYLHREGSKQLADDANKKWEDYIKKFKNEAKMPSGAAQYQNLANQSRYLLPRNNKFYGYFGNLGHLENRLFVDPDNRNRF